jgi:lysophospholipid acyltransferase (LPLAT)-like uncharacterized protein
MKKFLFRYVLPYIIYVLIYLCCITIRCRNKSPENEDFFKNMSGKYILTLWHSRIFYLFYYFRNRPDLNLLISPSEDGDLLARLAVLMGYSVIRGSTYKNSFTAARQLIAVLKKNQNIIVIADGSRGPRHKAQPGTVVLARITGSPLIPMTYNANRKFELDSWDRFLLPLPFTQCNLDFGRPISLPKDADKEFVEKKLNELESSLNTMTDGEETVPCG